MACEAQAAAGHDAGAGGGGRRRARRRPVPTPSVAANAVSIELALEICKRTARGEHAAELATAASVLARAFPRDLVDIVKVTGPAIAQGASVLSAHQVMSTADVWASAGVAALGAWHPLVERAAAPFAAPAGASTPPSTLDVAALVKLATCLQWGRVSAQPVWAPLVRALPHAVPQLSPKQGAAVLTALQRCKVHAPTVSTAISEHIAPRLSALSAPVLADAVGGMWYQAAGRFHGAFARAVDLAVAAADPTTETASAWATLAHVAGASGASTPQHVSGLVDRLLPLASTLRTLDLAKLLVAAHGARMPFDRACKPLWDLLQAQVSDGQQPSMRRDAAVLVLQLARSAAAAEKIPHVPLAAAYWGVVGAAGEATTPQLAAAVAAWPALQASASEPVEPGVGIALQAMTTRAGLMTLGELSNSLASTAHVLRSSEAARLPTEELDALLAALARSVVSRRLLGFGGARAADHNVQLARDASSELLQARAAGQTCQHAAAWQAWSAAGAKSGLPGARNVAQLVYDFGSASFVGKDSWSEAELWDMLVSAAAECMPAMSSAAICQTSLGLAHAGVNAGAWWHALGGEISARMALERPPVSPLDAAKLLWSARESCDMTEHAGLREPLHQLASVAAGAAGTELALAASSAAALGVWNRELVQALAHYGAGGVADWPPQALSQLHTVHVAIAGAGVCPEDIKAAWSLPAQVAQQAANAAAAVHRPHVSKLHRGVAAELAAMGATPATMEYITPHGLSLDIAWPQHNLALEVHGPQHFLGTMSQAVAGAPVNAATQFKRQLLTTSGWRVVELPWYVWPDVSDKAVHASARSLQLARARTLSGVLPEQIWEDRQAFLLATGASLQEVLAASPSVAAIRAFEPAPGSTASNQAGRPAQGAAPADTAPQHSDLGAAMHGASRAEARFEAEYATRQAAATAAATAPEPEVGPAVHEPALEQEPQPRKTPTLKVAGRRGATRADSLAARAEALDSQIEALTAELEAGSEDDGPLSSLLQGAGHDAQAFQTQLAAGASIEELAAMAAEKLKQGSASGTQQASGATGQNYAEVAASLHLPNEEQLFGSDVEDDGDPDASGGSSVRIQPASAESRAAIERARAAGNPLPDLEDALDSVPTQQSSSTAAAAEERMRVLQALYEGAQSKFDVDEVSPDMLADLSDEELVQLAHAADPGLALDAVDVAGALGLRNPYQEAVEQALGQLDALEAVDDADPEAMRAAQEAVVSAAHQLDHVDDWMARVYSADTSRMHVVNGSADAARLQRGPVEDVPMTEAEIEQAKAVLKARLDQIQAAGEPAPLQRMTDQALQHVESGLDAEMKEQEALLAAGRLDDVLQMLGSTESTPKLPGRADLLTLPPPAAAQADEASPAATEGTTTRQAQPATSASQPLSAVASGEDVRMAAAIVAHAVHQHARAQGESGAALLRELHTAVRQAHGGTSSAELQAAAYAAGLPPSALRHSDLQAMFAAIADMDYGAAIPAEYLAEDADSDQPSAASFMDTAAPMTFNVADSAVGIPSIDSVWQRLHEAHNAETAAGRAGIALVKRWGQDLPPALRKLAEQDSQQAGMNVSSWNGSAWRSYKTARADRVVAALTDAGLSAAFVRRTCFGQDATADAAFDIGVGWSDADEDGLIWGPDGEVTTPQELGMLRDILLQPVGAQSRPVEELLNDLIENMTAEAGKPGRGGAAAPADAAMQQLLSSLDKELAAGKAAGVGDIERDPGLARLARDMPKEDAAAFAGLESADDVAGAMRMLGRQRHDRMLDDDDDVARLLADMPDMGDSHRNAGLAGSSDLGDLPDDADELLNAISLADPSFGNELKRLQSKHGQGEFSRMLAQLMEEEDEPERR